MNPTVHFDGRALPAAAFNARCLASAASLLELGVGPGETVALLLHNEPLTLELMLAAREPFRAGRDQRA
jgi:acyl-CoA synthetase (AMP-forming)/AMP-acid ligase II